MFRSWMEHKTTSFFADLSTSDRKTLYKLKIEQQGMRYEIFY